MAHIVVVGHSEPDGPDLAALAAAFRARAYNVDRITIDRGHASKLSKDADFYIASGSPRLLNGAPISRPSVLWVSRPSRELLRWRDLSILARRRPVLAFLGAYHAASYPRWATGGPRAIVPPVPDDAFREPVSTMRPPPPFAFATVRDVATLKWVVDVWIKRIYPAAPKARLYILPSASLHATTAERLKPLNASGIALSGAKALAERVEELRQSRVLLHPGDETDMFGMPVAEAQAAGVPAVVCDITCLRERVVDGETGFVVAHRDAEAFAASTLRLLSDDALWRRQRDAAIGYNRTRGWPDVAAAFEALV